MSGSCTVHCCRKSSQISSTVQCTTTLRTKFVWKSNRECRAERSLILSYSTILKATKRNASTHPNLLLGQVVRLAVFVFSPRNIIQLHRHPVTSTAPALLPHYLQILATTELAFRFYPLSTWLFVQTSVKQSFWVNPKESLRDLSHIAHQTM